MEQVVVAVFEVESEAYQALSKLKADPAMSSYTISQMVLMSREGERVISHDGFDTGVKTLDDTARGGLIGSLIGLFSGPLGVLFFGGIGSLIGLAKDSGESEADLNIIKTVSGHLPNGKTALVALVDEASEEGLNAFFSMFSTIIFRLNAADVRRQIKEAEQAEAALAKEMKKKQKEEKKAVKKDKK